MVLSDSNGTHGSPADGGASERLDVSVVIVNYKVCDLLRACLRSLEPNLAGLLEGGNPGLWALVDLAMLRQEGDVNSAREKLLARWELVREYPTELNLPTLLDVDPSAVLTGRSAAVECPLLLLRPRGQGPSS